MISVASGRVTTSDARELDRAMSLLHRGRISYGRWVETLDAWARGEDVSTWDYGDAESLPDRIWVQLSGRAPVTAPGVADLLEVEAEAAATALHRLCRRGRARRVGHGQFSIGPFTPPVKESDAK